MIEIIAYGIPAPQGSKKFVGMSKAGHAVLLESSDKVEPWREAVKMAALRARGGAMPLDGPLIARVIFTMPKPKSAPKTRKSYPCRYPDLSKLLRSTEDALTNAGVWADDARVVEYERLVKVYPGEDPEALDTPGVWIRVMELHEVQVTVEVPRREAVSGSLF